MRPLFQQQIAFAGLLVFTGCTELPYLASSRVGYVSTIYSEEGLRRDPPECLRALAEPDLQGTKYVEIDIPHGRVHERVFAQLSPSVNVQLHDRVEFDPSNCSSGTSPEVKMVLTHH
jgi:hypothetical protein